MKIGGNPQNLTNAGKGRPRGSTNAYSIDNLKRAVVKVEKKHKINYLTEIIERSRRDSTLAKIILDKLIPTPKQVEHSGQIDSNIVIEHIPEKSQLNKIYSTLEQAGVFEKVRKEKENAINNRVTNFTTN